MIKNLLSKVVTVAQSNQLSKPFRAPTSVVGIALQGSLLYGSGGTSIDAWVQTTMDQGASWIDVAQFNWTTASAKKLFNLSGLTPITTIYTPTDATLAANTCKDGVLGDVWRVKYTTVGVYATNTVLSVDAAFRLEGIK